MRTRITTAVSLPLLLLAGIWTSGVSAREEIDFQVMVIPERGKNVVANYGAGSKSPTCSAKSHVGCYEVPRGQDAEVRVTLTNGDDACSRSESWRLREIVLGGEGDVNDPPEKPGDNGWGNLSAQAAKDFNADPVSGVAKVSRQGNTMTFQNLNTAAYSIWYKVRVESCAVDANGNRKVIEYDPRIDNRGSG